MSVTPPTSPQRLKRELSMLSKSNDSLHVKMQSLEDQNRRLYEDVVKWKYKYAQANERSLGLQQQYEDSLLQIRTLNLNVQQLQKKMTQMPVIVEEPAPIVEEPVEKVSESEQEIEPESSESETVESLSEVPQEEYQSSVQSEGVRVQNLDQELELNQLKDENDELLKYIQRLLLKISKCEEFEKLLGLD